ncbi:hypothetical protein GCM10020331_079470 [Ectobacillus funiculus]
MSNVANLEAVETLAINTIRTLSIDAVEKKQKSGHPGMPMGTAPMGHVLWSKSYESQSSQSILV